ncbi:hypothetical protein CDO52_17160 [Nocardiopsis gilva YIM 90087]|uniref:Uncharacterized protein n=1 Tax=Nocardiopsis gilva YIM 90087 TaxID=1235441 RepID=A0A223S839_9ACTN|nr:hypothetical protein [Nocardiopsis gilva]ASU84294.1 hypothetical protein CDO52_17160 [Nocardiopsis gilva YIM 90087]
MQRAWIRYRTATGFALTEHVRNRLALVMVVVFVPIWMYVVYGVYADDQVRIFLRASNDHVTAHGNFIGTVSGAINAVTVIVGFMMFIVTFRSAWFDQRLVMAGYPFPHLLAAKFTALVAAAASVSVYSAAVIFVFWVPEQPILMWAPLFGAALAYGGLGVALGVLLRGELEGMFFIIMLSIIDVGLQNPISNPTGESDIVQYFPSYGAMQSALSAGFLDTVPTLHLLLGPAWFLGAIAAAGVVLRLRTRDRRMSLLPVS